MIGWGVDVGVDLAVRPDMIDALSYHKSSLMMRTWNGEWSA